MNGINGKEEKRSTRNGIGDSVDFQDKVIAFDSWTGGVVNIERLVSAFKARGLNLFLLHIGSWGHDKSRPTEERIGTLLVRDILYYKGLSFKNILEQERPAAVLFLSTQAFAHQAINRYCRELGIPTLHLYHGVVCVQAIASKKVSRINPLKQMEFVWNRLMKNCFRLGPVYIKALVQTGANLRDWSWFIYDVWLKFLGRYSKYAAPDTTTSVCCVYTHADMQHAAQRYRLPVENIFSVGNPDLDKFGLTQDKVGGCLLRSDEVTKNVIYIETSLLLAGAVFSNIDDYAKHLTETKEALAKQNLRLLVKLHPASERTKLPSRLQQLGIEVLANKEFLALLNTASAAIVEPSSAALIPALLGLPLLMASYGKLLGQKYGVVLTNYPRARLLCSLDSITMLLEDIKKSSSINETRDWIDENIGPMPASQMPDRVAMVCKGLTQQKIIEGHSIQLA